MLLLAGICVLGGATEPIGAVPRGTESAPREGPYLPPHGGGVCASDWDCSLGGECTDKKCVCDPWFTGSNCTYLNLQRAKPDAGFQVPGFHSWGGHSVFDAKAQVWRGFFSFIVRRCTLSAWTTNSATVHATATDVDGYCWQYSYTGSSFDDGVLMVCHVNSIPTRGVFTSIFLCF